jgi:diguanylate cyclase (GGDEF)-like protein
MAPDEAFAEAKFRDHRYTTAILFTILVVFLPSMWLWDYVTDPVGAQNTVALRLANLAAIPLAMLYWSDTTTRRLLAVATLVFALVAEGLLVLVLDRISNGMVLGIGGFMYCMLLGIVGWQSFCLAHGLGYTFLAALLPHLMAWSGMVDGFPHVQYAILLWPGMGVTALTQVVLAHQYLQRYQLQQQLELRSNTDPLTGVSNRRHFMPLLEREVSMAGRMEQKVSLVIVDIDHFKSINDAYGHPAGDEVIRKVAALCGGACRARDVVARIGGEEFAILLPDCDLDQAAMVAERVRQATDKALFVVHGREPIRFTASLGVAEFGGSDGSALDLFARADAALYAAKAAGRNRVIAAEMGGSKPHVRQFEIWPVGMEKAERDKPAGFPMPQGQALCSWNQRGREDFRTRRQFLVVSRNDQLLGRLFFGGMDPQWGSYGAYLEIHFSREQRRILVVGCGFHGAEILPHQSLEPVTSIPLELDGSGDYFVECGCNLGFGWRFRATLEQRVDLGSGTWELTRTRAEIRNAHYRPLPHAPLQAPAWRWEDDSMPPLISGPRGAISDVLCPNCLGIGYRVAINLKQKEDGGPAHPCKGRVGCVVCGGSGEEYEPWYLVEHPELNGGAPFVKGSGVIRMERPARLQALRPADPPPGAPKPST